MAMRQRHWGKYIEEKAIRQRHWSKDIEAKTSRFFQAFSNVKGCV
jgi:hypothetical protein